MTITVISCHPFIAGPLTWSEAGAIALATETQFENDFRTKTPREGSGWTMKDGILLSIKVETDKHGLCIIHLIAEDFKESPYANPPVPV